MPPIGPNSANEAIGASALRRKTGIVIAVAALSVAISGKGASTTEKPEGGGQLRYFGGPKSPMWSTQ
jgi:hypothetical protein